MSKLRVTRHDLPEKARRSVVDLINAQMADALDLAMACKQAQWNVLGAHFLLLHELFGRLALELQAELDSLALRIKALGGQVTGTVHNVAKRSSFKPYPIEAMHGSDHLNALAERFAAFAKKQRASIDACTELGDAGTADLFTSLSRSADQRLWWLEAQSSP